MELTPSSFPVKTRPEFTGILGHHPDYDQTSPSVAFDGTDYLVAWQDYRSNSTWDIYGGRVTTGGAPEDGNGFMISGADYDQTSPSVAYDGTDYLVAWQDHRSGSSWDIYGQRVNTSGGLDGSAITISDATNNQQSPAVAYDGTNCLVVWQDARNFSTDWDIYGARVNTGGSVLDYPNAILVTGAVNVQTNTAVAFDGTDYLVAWQDNRGGNWDVCGGLVPATGTPPGGAGFVISLNTPSSNQTYPSVAFDGTNYLVVWQDDRNAGTGMDIYGQFVNTSGGLEGSAITISNADHDQKYPSVAYDGTNYLVVWQDERNDDYDDIYGARVTTSGAVLDQGDNAIHISAEGGYDYNPRVASDGTGYLVVWSDYVYDWTGDVYGALVGPSGRPGAEFPIAAENEMEEWQPSVDFDGTDYLVVWQDARNNSSYDIYGARVTTSGAVLDQGENAIEISAKGSDDYFPAVAFDGTNYLVVWQDNDDNGIHGRTLSLGLVPGEVYDFSPYRSSGVPAVACGPVEGKAMVAYQSVTGVVDEVDYWSTNRMWARQATLPLTGDVGTVSIERPVASFLTDGSWPIPPMAQVHNYGSETRSFNATFTISPYQDGWSSTKTVLGLRPSETRSVAFGPFDLATAGPNLYTTTCQTMLPGDGNDNNTKDSTFQGCNFDDFFDLNDGGLTKSGAWTRDTAKRSTWTWPPMDTFVWGNGVYGSYRDDENSTLTSPTYQALQNHPAIAFQHNYNTEASHDGGHFLYSTGDFSQWDSLYPSAGLGYNGAVAALHDTWGWSGNSGGWKQSVFTIPVNQNVQFKVRWHFAADGDGTTGAGWLLDEVAGINCDLYVGPGGASILDTMNVWPDPVRGQGQVSYTLRKDCNVSINLYDASGRLAARVPTTGCKKGPNTATLDATRLARGVYFVKVKGETDTKTSKVIIE